MEKLGNESSSFSSLMYIYKYLTRCAKVLNFNEYFDFTFISGFWIFILKPYTLSFTWKK